MRHDLLIIRAFKRQPRNEACLSKVLAAQGLQLEHQGASAAQLSELLQERAALQARLDMMQQHAAETLQHAASAQVSSCMLGSSAAGGPQAHGPAQAMTVWLPQKSGMRVHPRAGIHVQHIKRAAGCSRSVRCCIQNHGR